MDSLRMGKFTGNIPNFDDFGVANRNPVLTKVSLAGGLYTLSPLSAAIFYLYWCRHIVLRLQTAQIWNFAYKFVPKAAKSVARFNVSNPIIIIVVVIIIIIIIIFYLP